MYYCRELLPTIFHIDIKTNQIKFFPLEGYFKSNLLNNIISANYINLTINLKKEAIKQFPSPRKDLVKTSFQIRSQTYPHM